MTYRDYVYAMIADYAAAQIAVVTIPEQIAAERSRRESLRATRTDGDRVTSGETRTDEALLSSIATETYLEKRLDAAKHTVAAMTEALGQLDADEREVFARLLFRRERNATGDLAEDWGVDVRTIYRAKDRTLRKLARMLTGEARA